MSSIVDSKIVEMVFDNKKFEQNVQTSVDSVENLKKSLTFDGVEKGFANIENASKNVNFQGMNDAIDTVKVKFSAFEVMAITALANITNRVVDAGIALSKSLSIDQVTAGWSKYAQKTSSVQTIMAATNETWQLTANELARVDKLVEEGMDKTKASQLASVYTQIADGTLSMSKAAKQLGMSKSDLEKYSDGLKDISYAGTQMEFVSDELDKLNWFSDETSYSFVDMTSNIGKFTSTGQKLTDSVTAMQGISTWAALSGANVEQASRAMYNLSQALGTGAVKLIDWKSIENANMATAEFKQTVLDTAVDLGMLKKTANGLYVTLDKGTEVSVKNFNAALSEGWFSNDVLMATLDKYGAFTNKLYEASEKTGMTATQLLKATDKYKEGSLDLSKVAEQTGMSVEDLTAMFGELGSETYDLGRRAFQAAQEAKTFQEAIEATKDAVSTGWMNTFELIFGNYEEAKELWTNVANELYDIFAAGAEARNELLGGWKELGGRKALFEAVANTWGALKHIIETVKEAFRDIFPPMTSKRLVEITEHIRDLTAKFKLSDEATENLKNTFKGLFAVLDIFVQIGKSVFKIFGNVLGSLTGVGSGLLGLTGGMGKALVKFDEFIKKTQIFEKAVAGISDFITDLIEDVRVGFWEGGGGITGVVEVIFDVLATFVRGIFDMASAITGIDFSKVCESIVTGIQKVRNTVVEHLGGIINFVKEFPTKFKEAFQKLTGVDLGEAFEKVKEKISSACQSIKESIEGFRGIDTSGVDSLGDKVKNKFAPITAIFEGLKTVFGAIVKLFKKLAPVFAKLAEIFGKALTHFGNAVSDGIDHIDMDSLLDLVNGGILLAIATGVKKIMDSFAGISENANGILNGIKGVLDGVKGCLTAWQQQLKAKTLLTIASAIAVLTASLVVLSTIDEDKLSSSMAAITAEFIDLMAAMKILTKTMSGKDGKNVSKASTSMIKMAAAVLVLSVAMKNLSSLNYEEIARGGIAIAALSAILVQTSKSLSKDQKRITKGMTGLIAFAVAIRLLVKPVKELAALDMNSLTKGLAGLLGIIGSLVLFFKTTDLDGMSIGKGTGLLIFAEAIKVLAKAVKAFGELDASVLIKGLYSLTIVLAELAAFVKITDGSKKVISTATGLVILGAAMLIFKKAIEGMGSLGWEQIGKGLLTMAAALAVVAIAINNLPKSTAIIAVGLVLVGSALLIIGHAVENMGEMSWEEIGKGLLTMSVALLAITVALNAMKGTLGGSAAMLIMANALLILVPVLKILGSMDLAEIGKGLLALAGIFAVIGVAAHALAPAIPAILGLAAAIALLGVGVLACAAGLLLFSVAMTTFAAAGTAGTAAFVLSVEAVLSLIPQIVVKIGEGILKLIEVVASATPELIAAAKDIALGILDTALELVPKLIEVLDVLLAKLAEHMPSISKSVVKIVRQLIGVLSDLMGDIVELVIDTVLKILKALEKKMPDIIQAGFDLVIAFIDGLGEAMVKNAARLRDAILNLFKNMFKAVLEFFGIHSPSKKFFEVGVEIIMGLIKGLLSLAAKLLSTLLGIFVDLIKAVGEKIGEFLYKGKEIIGNIIKGIGNMLKDIWDAITGAIGHAFSAAGEAIKGFLEVGKDIINFIVDGIKALWDFLKGGVQGAIEFAMNGVKLIGGLIDLIKDVGGWVINRVKDGIEGAKGLLKTAAQTAIEWAAKGVKLISGLIDKIKDLGSWIGGKISEGISAAKGLLKTAAEGIISFATKAKNLAKEIWDNIYDLGKKLGSKLADGIKAAKDLVKRAWDWLTNPGAINTEETEKKIKEAAEQQKKNGALLNAGTASGIESSTGLVTKAVSNTTKKATKQYEKDLDINSPSRVFAKLGEYTLMGLPEGFKAALPVVLESIEDTNDTVIDAMSSIVSDIYDSFDTDVECEPTITPVLDLSNIESGSGYINDILSGNRAVSMAANANENVNQQLINTNRTLAATEELKELLKNSKQGDEITNVNNTFNIKSNNPREVADEVSRTIQRQIERRDAVWA